MAFRVCADVSAAWEPGNLLLTHWGLAQSSLDSRVVLRKKQQSMIQPFGVSASGQSLLFDLVNQIHHGVQHSTIPRAARFLQLGFRF